MFRPDFQTQDPGYHLEWWFPTTVCRHQRPLPRPTVHHPLPIDILSCPRFRPPPSHHRLASIATTSSLYRHRASQGSTETSEVGSYFYQPFKEDELEQSTEVPIIFPAEPKPFWISDSACQRMESETHEKIVDVGLNEQIPPIIEDIDIDNSRPNLKPFLDSGEKLDIKTGLWDFT
ncbi:hypothetical protein Fmac_008416 [Flemingia macrophylla]|uniref:Uncharacterized protein n=1 Tax=Flemingia macrophylla TaxID=520843 RepID=A0ABD1MXC7_9FABA